MTLAATAIEGCEWPIELDPQSATDWMLGLHRHKDGIITIGRLKGEDLKHVHSFLASWFRDVFPAFQSEFLNDSYMGVNAAGTGFVPGDSDLFKVGHMSPFIKGRSVHRAKNIVRLNAVYCDIDCGPAPDKKMTLDQAFPKAVAMIDAGELPRPTGLILSGSGFWLLWYLHDERSPEHSHLRSHPDEVLLYKEVNKAIFAKLAHLGADVRAKDAARVTALPGTHKSKYGGKQVVWRRYPGGRSYALSELAQLVGAALRSTPSERIAMRRTQQSESGRPCRTFSSSVSPEISEMKRRAWRARMDKNFAIFAMIKDLRDGFREPGRDNAAFILALCLRAAKWPESAAVAKVREFGIRDCYPELPAEVCETKVRSAYGQDSKWIDYQSMADFLEVTLPEAAEINSLLKPRKTFPPMTGSGTLVAPLTGKAKKTACLNALTGIAKSYGHCFSERELMRALGDRGLQVSEGTVHNYVRELGFETAGKTRAHAKKTSLVAAESHNLKLAV